MNASGNLKFDKNVLDFSVFTAIYHCIPSHPHVSWNPNFCYAQLTTHSYIHASLESPGGEGLDSNKTSSYLLKIKSEKKVVTFFEVHDKHLIITIDGR